MNIDAMHTALDGKSTFGSVLPSAKTTGLTQAQIDTLKRRDNINRAVFWSIPVGLGIGTYAIAKHYKVKPAKSAVIGTVVGVGFIGAVIVSLFRTFK